MRRGLRKGAGDYVEMGHSFDEACLSSSSGAGFDTGIDVFDAFDAVGSMLQAVRRFGLSTR